MEIKIHIHAPQRVNNLNLNHLISFSPSTCKAAIFFFFFPFRVVINISSRGLQTLGPLHDSCVRLCIHVLACTNNRNYNTLCTTYHLCTDLACAFQNSKYQSASTLTVHRSMLIGSLVCCTNDPVIPSFGFFLTLTLK